jgi:predicted class III extradiol MEMO1 family dioxygenase
MEEKRDIWMRAGMYIEADRETLNAILAGDKDKLIEVLKSGSFTLAGDSFIPAVSVLQYATEYGEDIPAEDVGFYL